MTLITVSKQIELDAGHRVPFHASKCKNLHGHRYKIQVDLTAPDVIRSEKKSSESGMVMDFGLIKVVLMSVIHDVYDHSLILWNQDPIWNDLRFKAMIREYQQNVIPIPVIPTAEELARYWAKSFCREWETRLGEQHREIGVTLKRFRVWETPNSYADFE